MQPAIISAQATTAALSETSDPPSSAFELSTFAPAGAENTKEALKQTYLDCLKNVKSKAEALRQSVVALLAIGIPWQQLGAWAKAAGLPDRYSQKLLSQILLDLGIRRREPGAGPKPPREAYLVENYVNDLYAEDSLKFLRAACEVARARQEGEFRGAAEELAIESIEVHNYRNQLNEAEDRMSES